MSNSTSTTNQHGLDGFSTEELEQEMKRRKKTGGSNDGTKKPPPLGPSKKHNLVKRKPSEDNDKKKPPPRDTSDQDNAPTKKKPKKESLLEEWNSPEPGHICSSHRWYCCEYGDTLTKIANKLGISYWKLIAELPENVERYGNIGSNSCLLKYTLLLIPTEKCSKWKLQGITKEANKQQAIMEREKCVDCGKETTRNLLLCDGCDR